MLSNSVVQFVVNNSVLLIIPFFPKNKTKRTMPPFIYLPYSLSVINFPYFISGKFVLDHPPLLIEFI